MNTTYQNAKPVTQSDKQLWITWIHEQLDTSNNETHLKSDGTNRVFLTEEDDIGIAKYILETFLATIKNI